MDKLVWLAYLLEFIVEEASTTKGNASLEASDAPLVSCEDVRNDSVCALKLMVSIDNYR